jgi:hypothetical protein
MLDLSRGGKTNPKKLFLEIEFDIYKDHAIIKILW